MKIFHVYLAAFIGFGCGRTPSVIDKAHDIMYSLNNLHQLAAKVIAYDKKGMLVKDSILLDTPRIDYGITPEILRYYFKHAMISLCTPAQLKQESCYCEGKFRDPKLFYNETLDAQSAVAIDDINKLVVVSYRITVSEMNWQTNYKSNLVSHPSIDGPSKVHEGHLEYVISLQPMMEPTVVEMLKRYPNHKLHITGYSLGASLAIIALPFFTELLKANQLANKVQVFSYAGSRPGNFDFAKYVETLGAPIARYAQKGDVVSHVSDQALGYSQAGLEFYDSTIPFLKKSFVKCSLYVIEDMDCSMKDRHFYVPIHVSPFQQPIPSAPYC
ncbi:hypothetical protein DSO57_1030765 [Entomophthora muscae]|uniref:Uncharacterized protein n=1 Tax=Entomophthora muscae TaxID=34485 RepID=A0ACC2SPW0_9FUNG|nr:hypothetical protein DSO57_1030765 [Entomophthora muscae]